MVDDLKSSDDQGNCGMNSLSSLDVRNQRVREFGLDIIRTD